MCLVWCRWCSVKALAVAILGSNPRSVIIQIYLNIHFKIDIQ